MPGGDLVTAIQGNVDRLDNLRDGNGEFLSGIVNVAGNVNLYDTDLERLPVRFGTVGGDFYCHENRLTSLEGAPGTVGGYFGCNNNRLTSLEGAPHSVGGNFWCTDNRLTSLVGVHRILRRIDGKLDLWGNKIKSGGIGLILVEGLTKIVVDQPALKIVEQYLGQGMRGVLRCQEALHEAGFGEFARL